MGLGKVQERPMASTEYICGATMLLRTLDPKQRKVLEPF